MSTYCISDIHGYKQELEKMLDKIAFCANDELYIIGDLVDRGPESADLLVWAVDDATDNIHFMLGNHEDMMHSTLVSNPSVEYIDSDDPWMQNGGRITLNDLKFMVDARWVEYRLLPWVEHLPVYQKVEVKGKPFMLVHAGFNPGLYDSVPKSMRYDDIECDYNPNPNARRGKLRVGSGFGTQDIQNMLWQRDTWLKDPHNAPCDVVCGHTYVNGDYVKDLRKTGKFAVCYGGNGRIAHIENKHIIDGGCAKASLADDFDTGQYNLTCLRLDDMKEFYVPCRRGVDRYAETSLRRKGD